MNVFDACLEHGKRSGDRGRYTSALALKMASRMRAHEIEALRATRKTLRADTRRSDINGAYQVLEMHTLEHEAIRQMCPEIAGPDQTTIKKAWQWVLKQPWAEEFKPPSFDGKLKVAS